MKKMLVKWWIPVCLAIIFVSACSQASTSSKPGGGPNKAAAGRIGGRQNASQITGFVNNLGHGAQFAAVGATVYRLAQEKGLGQKLSTEWFLQDIHP